MLILDRDDILALVERERFSAKMVFNGNGAVLFSVKREHRDQSAPGICYRDNYAGDALAAMLGPGHIEIRYHQDFADAEVARILAALLADPRLAPIAGFVATYQGRRLNLPGPRSGGTP